MQRCSLTIFLITVMIVGALVLPIAAYANNRLMQNWLATGIVTRRDGSTIYMLAKDNVVYKIDAGNARLRMDVPNHPIVMNVGDRIRVFGTQTSPTSVKAKQILIYLRTPSESVPSVEPPPVTEQPVTPSPAGPGAGPTTVAPPIGQPDPVPTVEVPRSIETESGWTGRGFISSMSIWENIVTVQTAQGAFNINVADAYITNGEKKLLVSDLSVGDAVRIYGDVTGLNKIKADQVVLLRQRTDLDSQLGAKPTTLRGKITSMDLPSFTFRMGTDATPVSVVVDETTRITMHGKVMAFMDLKPGAIVVVSGLGSPAAGYAAKSITIVSMPPQ